MNGLSLIGICCGLAAAVCHSLSYLFSRRAVAHSPRDGVDRFIEIHLIMGAVALLFLPVVLRLPLPSGSQMALALGWSSGFYLIGQACFFVLNRYASPSLCAPLLGLKILFVALLSMTLLGNQVAPMEWTASALAVLATYTLNASAGRLPLRAAFWLVAACCGYAMSDAGIANLTNVLAPGLNATFGNDYAALAAPLVGVCLTYSLCGLLALAAALLRRRPIIRPSLPTIGFAATWMGAMVCLFTSIALAGLVTAIILQAMRGLFSYLLANALPWMGIDATEDGGHRSVWRFSGAFLMVMAAILAAMAKRS